MIRKIISRNSENPKVADIKLPQKKNRRVDLGASKNGKIDLGGKKRGGLSPFLFYALSILILIAVIFVGWSAYNFQGEIIGSLKDQISEFRDNIGNFKIIGGEKDGVSLSDYETRDLKKPFGSSITEKIWPLFSNSIGAYKQFQGLAKNGFTLLSKLQALFSELPDLVFKQNGGDLIFKIEEIHAVLKNISESNKALIAAGLKLGELSNLNSEFTAAFDFDIAKFEKFTGALASWLGSPKVHHIMVMLQNPSEIRPAGGFLGSYIDLSIKDGKIMELDVHDVNDADRTFNQKFVPPEPVQLIAKKFTIADSNWFFDFPTSARTVLQFIDSTDLYKDREGGFDGVVALSPTVVSDLLALTGPLALGDGGKVIDKNNFILEIQKDIQTNRASGESYPKEILRKITPLLFEKLGSLGQSEKNKFYDLVRNWVEKKDLQIYFKDPTFQDFFQSFGITGEIAEVSQGFYGNYLAVVNANLGGGKTDIFIDQTIKLENQIGVDGVVRSNLEITKKHRGDEADAWWYKEPSQTFTQVITNKESRLLEVQGGVAKKITPKINYKKEGYLIHPLISEIEATKKEFTLNPQAQIFEAFGRSIFATWIVVKPGKTEKTNFKYETKLLGAPSSGKVYKFIFEKQAGVKSDYIFEISAPSGFHFKENDLPIYEYKSSDIPARLMIELTLKKA